MLTRRIAPVLCATFFAVLVAGQEAPAEAETSAPAPWCFACTKTPPATLADGVAATWDLGAPAGADDAPKGFAFAERRGRTTEITIDATIPQPTVNYSIYLVDATSGKVIREYPVKAMKGTIRRAIKSQADALTVLISAKPGLKEFTASADVILASAPQAAKE